MRLIISVVAYILVFTASYGVSSPLKDSDQLFKNLKNKGEFNSTHTKIDKHLPF